MKELWKKTALLAAVGLATGILVGLGFLLPNGILETFTQRGSGWALAYMLICGAMGMINMGTMTIYEIEHWSLTRATLTHFAITLSTFCGLGLFLGWFRSTLIIVMLALFVIAYFIIWLSMYLSYRRQVRRMNEELRHWKETQQEE